MKTLRDIQQQIAEKLRGLRKKRREEISTFRRALDEKRIEDIHNKISQQ